MRLLIRDLLQQDLRYGARALAKKPAFTLVAVLALALGIGANATIFSLVNALLLRSPVANQPERLVNLHVVSRDGSGFHNFSFLDIVDYREQNPVFEELAAWSISMVSLSTGDEASVAVGQIVSENYFNVFGLPPALGRFFLPEEGQGDGAHPVAVIGHDLWQKLGGEASVLDHVLHINNQPFAIVGVAPKGFTGAFGAIDTEIFVPLTMHALIQPDANMEIRGSHWLEAVGRLAPDVSKEEAKAFLNTRYRQIADANPDQRREGGIELGEFGTVPGQMRGGVGAFMAILMGMVGLLLLITCVNVAGMLLSRAAGRRREIAVRLAMGAGRGRLVRQLITESLMLFALGGIAGTLIAHWAVRLFLAIKLPLPVPLALELGVDPRVLAFTLGITLATGLLFGLAPALQATRVDLVSSLKDEGGQDGSGRLRLRNVFVVAQVAVALLLLIGAGLFLRSLSEAAHIDPGFDAEGVHLATLDLSLHGYGEDAGVSFYNRLVERVGVLPGVQSVSLGRVVPLGLSNSDLGFNVPGHEPPAGDNAHVADVNVVDETYFKTMGISILAGREFSGAERAGAPLAVVINSTLARHFWPEDNPIGEHIQLGTGTAPLAEIVGIAADGKYRTLGEEPRFYIYRSFAQRYEPRMKLHVRTTAGSADVPRAIRTEIRALDPNLPVAEEMSLEDYISVSMLPQRIASTVTGILGVLGLLLVSTGVYGVTAFAVSQRTREFGVRMALGAKGQDVLSLVLGQGLRLAAVGVALGLVGAFAVTRVLSSLLYGVSATDPWIFGGMSLVLVGIVLLGECVSGVAGDADRSAQGFALRVGWFKETPEAPLPGKSCVLESENRAP